MSTYQYYEFRAVDRPLTKKEQEEVRSLSSRAIVTPYGATFVYNYGDFRGKPMELLRTYYDLFFYIANWGTVKIGIRFPKALVDEKQFELYVGEDRMWWEIDGAYLMLIIEIRERDSDGWIDGDGMLDYFLHSFSVRLKSIRDQYSRRSGLMDRLKRAGLK